MSKPAKTGGVQGVVPKMRFSEFCGNAAWPTEPLGAIELEGRIELGRGEVISHHDMETEPGTYPVYSSSVRNNGCIGAYGKFMFDEEMISWSIDGGGDFFYRPKHRFSVTNVSGYMKVHSQEIVTRFLAYQLQVLHSHREFDYQTKAHPSVIRGLYKLAIPERAEQQKIAACLSSLDDLIAARADKLAALKQHKQGLLEQLFPREGETVPRLRFPKFRNAGAWIPMGLGQLVDMQSGGTPSKSMPELWDGLIPWASAKDLKHPVLTDTEDHISSLAIDGGAKLAPPEALFILVRGMTLLKDVPVCVLSRSMAFNQDIKALRPKSGMDGLFLAFQLLARKASLLALVDVAGHGTGKLDTDELRAFALLIPRLGEQQKIAACLSSLDDLITAASNQLAALKQHKQGLLQQLFPTLEEVAA